MKSAYRSTLISIVPKICVYHGINEKKTVPYFFESGLPFCKALSHNSDLRLADPGPHPSLMACSEHSRPCPVPPEPPNERAEGLP